MLRKVLSSVNTRQHQDWSYSSTTPFFPFRFFFNDLQVNIRRGISLELRVLRGLSYRSSVDVGFSAHPCGKFVYSLVLVSRALARASTWFLFLSLYLSLSLFFLIVPWYTDRTARGQFQEYVLLKLTRRRHNDLVLLLGLSLDSPSQAHWVECWSSPDSRVSSHLLPLSLYTLLPKTKQR